MDETHSEWRRSVRGFVDREIMPFVEEWEEAGRIPRELFKKAKAAGILGIGYPTEYGGEGTEFDRFHGIVTSEELARIGAGGDFDTSSPETRGGFSGGGGGQGVQNRNNRQQRRNRNRR